MTGQTSLEVASPATGTVGVSSPLAGQSPAPAADWSAAGRELVSRIPVDVRALLGTCRMTIGKIMSLSAGSVVPLDRKIGDLVDIMVNDRILARGEVVILDEAQDRFAVVIREVVT